MNVNTFFEKIFRFFKFVQFVHFYSTMLKTFVAQPGPQMELADIGAGRYWSWQILELADIGAGTGQDTRTGHQDTGQDTNIIPHQSHTRQYYARLYYALQYYVPLYYVLQYYTLQHICTCIYYTLQHICTCIYYALQYINISGYSG